MKKILQVYGSVGGFVHRLNQLGSLRAVAAECGVAPSTALWFARAHGVVQIWTAKEPQEGDGVGEFFARVHSGLDKEKEYEADERPALAVRKVVGR